VNERALRAALLKLQVKEALPVSRFTPAQRRTLDDFARRTGAVSCQRQGAGDIYRIADRSVFDHHLSALSPATQRAGEPGLPARARHIGHARDSKARRHQHDHYYPMLKAIGPEVFWHNQDAPRLTLPLSQLTHDFGAASLDLVAEDGWHSLQPLWLVENQALFDRIDWLPPDTTASLLYYGGQLDGRLLDWLAQRPRASRIILFPDYDGVGLANFARLHARLGATCACWLMPDWSDKLARYGSNWLWRNTLRDFTNAAPQLPDDLMPLIRQMQHSALALEQEAVWLP
jgi:hypothetical protein